ncbi:MAG: type II toxin-antitoxin system VapC family toxin [Nanoarchaeota archaeon]
MIKYCLDSDVIIDFLHGEKAIVEKIKNLLEDSIPFITSITLCELFRGAYLTKNPEIEIKKIDTLMDNMLAATLDRESSKVFGRKNKELSDKGKQTEIPDLMIASICIANDLVLVTRNKKHFENILGLKFEVW